MRWNVEKINRRFQIRKQREKQNDWIKSIQKQNIKTNRNENTNERHEPRGL